MTLRGACLCGAVVFEIDRIEGPFEICHCSRCRKVSGSTGMAAIEVSASEFRFVQGADHIGRYEAPLLHGPPAYVVPFCRTCGSPLPDPKAAGDSLEIPAGLLEDDPGIRPDKHIFVDFKAPWDDIGSEIPTFTMDEIRRHRRGD